MPDMEQVFSRQAELVMAHWMSVSPDTHWVFCVWHLVEGQRSSPLLHWYCMSWQQSLNCV